MLLKSHLDVQQTHLRHCEPNNFTCYIAGLSMLPLFEADGLEMVGRTDDNCKFGHTGYFAEGQ